LALAGEGLDGDGLVRLSGVMLGLPSA